MTIRAIDKRASPCCASLCALIACLAGWPAAQATLAPDFSEAQGVARPGVAAFSSAPRVGGKAVVTWDGPHSSFSHTDGGADAARVGAIQMLIDDTGQPNLRVAVDDAMTALPEPSTWFMGAGALAVLLCFARSVHSQGSGVIRIGKSQ
jgi:hypothetical protein